MHVYKIIKQLFHACSGNSQNYCPSVLEITVAFGLRPQATVLKSSPAPRVNSFDCSLNRHEITVYHYLIVKFCMFYKVFFIFNYFWGFGFLVFYCLVFYCLATFDLYCDWSKQSHEYLLPIGNLV